MLGLPPVPKVRILADDSSPGYRLADAAAEAFGALPVSDDLARQLAEWSGRWERQCDPLSYEDLTGKRFDFVAFATEGLALAKQVKRELPGWTVTYWDEAVDWYLSREPRSYDPRRSEYEITMKMAAPDPDSPAAR